MMSSHQVPAKVEQIGDRSMDSHESLRLLHGLESSHSSLPLPGHLVRLLRPIILILLSTVNRVGHDLSLSYRITSQLISHDLSGLGATGTHQPPEEALCCCTITSGLQIHINDFTILVDRSPQVMLLAVYLYEDFIDVESVAVTAVLALQATSINSSKLDAPEADRLPSDDDAPLCQKIFNIPMAEIKTVVEPNSIRNDIGRESVAFIGIHRRSLPIRTS